VINPATLNATITLRILAMLIKKILLPVSLAMLLSACTWVELSTEGKKVRVLGADEVTNCQLVGQTTSTTAASVAGIPRHENAIRDELDNR